MTRPREAGACRHGAGGRVYAIRRDRAGRPGWRAAGRPRREMGFCIFESRPLVTPTPGTSRLGTSTGASGITDGVKCTKLISKKDSWGKLTLRFITLPACRVPARWSLFLKTRGPACSGLQLRALCEPCICRRCATSHVNGRKS